MQIQTAIKIALPEQEVKKFQEKGGEHLKLFDDNNGRLSGKKTVAISFRIPTNPQDLVAAGNPIFTAIVVIDPPESHRFSSELNTELKKLKYFDRPGKYGRAWIIGDNTPNTESYVAHYNNVQGGKSFLEISAVVLSQGKYTISSPFRFEINAKDVSGAFCNIVPVNAPNAKNPNNTVRLVSVPLPAVLLWEPQHLPGK